MKKKLFNLIIILITAIALVILSYSTSGNDEVTALLKSLKISWIYTAILCMVLYWLFDALIFHIICRTLLEKFKFSNSLRFSMMGQFFNAITPFSSGGQPLQAYCMIRDGVKPGHAVSILVIRSMVFQSCLFISSIIVFILKASYFIKMVPQFLLFFLFGLFINLLVLLLCVLFLLNKAVAEKAVNFVFAILKKVRIIKRPERYVGKIETELESFKEGVDACRGKMTEIFKVVILQMIQFAAFFSIPFFIFKAMETGQGQFFNIFSTQAILTMITLLVPTPGASGGAEGMSYLFLNHFFSSGHIMPSILILRTITFYFNLIFGGLVSVISPEKPFKTITK